MDDLTRRLDEYLKKHLKEYMLFNLASGYELATIVRVLKKYGYTDLQLKDIISELPDTKHKVHPPQYDPKELSKDTRYYLEGVLLEYVGKMLEHGYAKPAIKQALINYGHHPAMVNAIFLQMRPVKVPFISSEIIIFGSLIVYGLISVALLLQLEGPPIAAALFAPGFLGLVITGILGKVISFKKLIPIIQGFLVVLLYIGIIMLLTEQMIDLSSFDTGIILGVNLALSTLLSIVIITVMDR